jgi:hypothetical protein
MSWSAKELKQWVQETIVEMGPGDQEVIRDILNSPPKALRTKPFSKIHDAITILAQYGLFINDQLNSAKARARYYEKVYGERLSLVLSANEIKGKSKEEREMAAIRSDKKLQRIYDAMHEYKTKAQRLEGLPYSITMYFNVLMEIYRLKLHQKKYENE